MTENNRINRRFAKLKAENKKAFIAFATAGFPNLNVYPDLLSGLAKSGADLIEVGMPFSDPMADGPAIQAAGTHAIKEGTTLPKILRMVEDFRKTDEETPILLMGYYNPIYSYGMMKFLDDAKKAGVDGFIMPDLPPEEDEEFRIPAADRELILVRFVTPTTDAKRLPTILKGADGFLYYVSITGITGSKSASAENVHAHIDMIRSQTQLPLAIGFGVNTHDQAKDMAKIADGVIVGTAITKRIASHLDLEGKPDTVAVSDTLSFVKELADAVHNG